MPMLRNLYHVLQIESKRRIGKVMCTQQHYHPNILLRPVDTHREPYTANFVLSLDDYRRRLRLTYFCRRVNKRFCHNSKTDKNILIFIVTPKIQTTVAAIFGKCCVSEVRKRFALCSSSFVIEFKEKYVRISLFYTYMCILEMT